MCNLVIHVTTQGQRRHDHMFSGQAGDEVSKLQRAVPGHRIGWVDCAKERLQIRVQPLTIGCRPVYGVKMLQVLAPGAQQHHSRLVFSATQFHGPGWVSPVAMLFQRKGRQVGFATSFSGENRDDQNCLARCRATVDGPTAR
jgi:hypothetical protein